MERKFNQRRDFRKPEQNRGSFGGFDRTMHKAVCSECGQECEVPFKPTEGKPVFCKECYRKKKGF